MMLRKHPSGISDSRTGKVSRAGGHGGHHDMPRVAGRGRNMMISSFPRRNLFGRCSGHAQRAVMNNDGGALGKVWDELRGLRTAKGSKSAYLLSFDSVAGHGEDYGNESFIVCAGSSRSPVFSRDCDSWGDFIEYRPELARELVEPIPMTRLHQGRCGSLVAAKQSMAGLVRCYSLLLVLVDLECTIDFYDLALDSNPGLKTLCSQSLPPYMLWVFLFSRLSGGGHCSSSGSRDSARRQSGRLAGLTNQRRVLQQSPTGAQCQPESSTQQPRNSSSWPISDLRLFYTILTTDGRQREKAPLQRPRKSNHPALRGYGLLG
ncbi:hypothetical protein RRG08_062028 [Elysia crispata]|uniref:Uncharacterized protein n=1 Tax=Elysia crispata TaxID=231223 RepID=A0AAE1DRT3_9GAST|nr:hypothetical protein RRG08_062028 [Elysia crispata]